jgi:N-acetylglucosamine-6-phosphate deacetylase
MQREASRVQFISMLDAVRMMQSIGVSDVEIAQMASTNPARLLKLEHECGLD